MKKYFTSLLVLLLGFSSFTEAARIHPFDNLTAWNNNIPPRLQWNENYGYCGEVSLISAGLYYGQYISQYEARTLASPNIPQNDPNSQLLFGRNATIAASQMHLNTISWNGKNSTGFLAWVKQNVVKGFPVAIGVYTNENLFYTDTDPDAGDDEYDHIVPVTGIHSNHPLNDGTYYSDDILYFNDNGLWAPSHKPVYLFEYSFGAFQANREQANSPTGSIYSLSNATANYGMAITGVMDLNGDTLPVRLDTNVNFEEPKIVPNTSEKPAPMPITLTVTVSNLQPGVLYNLYGYNNMTQVPHSGFNANAAKAFKKWQFKAVTGTTYHLTEDIQSDEVAVYRAVKATAP